MCICLPSNEGKWTCEFTFLQRWISSVAMGVGAYRVHMWEVGMLVCRTQPDSVHVSADVGIDQRTAGSI